MGYEAGIFHTQTAKITETHQEDRCIRSLWANALKVLISDACAEARTPTRRHERDQARAFLTSPYHRDDRSYYDMALNYSVGTVDRIGRKLEASGWAFDVGIRID